MKPPKQLLEHAKSVAKYGPGMYGNIEHMRLELEHHRDNILEEIKRYKRRREEIDLMASEQEEMIEWLKSIGEYENEPETP